MFPAFFSMACVCCATLVTLFGYFHLWKSASAPERYQLGFLLSAFAFILTNLFVFTAMTIENDLVGTILRQKQGKEIENLNSFDLYQCPGNPDVLPIT
ncbi:hypothetical protein HHK36_028367 [Tetracentron sinense]|uniref:TMEM205-like domain-containing protein n=1 Tax=Tetracentron sinense TaxID=13715 RepID=A0A835D0E2_TETSI|nr:hypothetical protein HHK36_028367 [Tetracentron sinense]